MSPSSYRGRFAPSPTGALHGGSLLAALGSWLLAHHAHGQWLVRMEDLDPPREVPGAARAQLEMLGMLGVHSDAPVLWQHTRHAAYQAALEQLMEAGLAFHCHCSRSDLAATGGIHHRCVARANRPVSAVRLRVGGDSIVTFQDGLQGLQQQDVRTAVGDFVLRRADCCWAYQLAVVVDDAHQGFTDIVRGADLLDSTPRQILLQRALSLPTPRYLHLPVLADAHGHKLSKSEAATPLDGRHALAHLLATWSMLGQAGAALRQATSIPEALQLARQHFDPSRLPAQPRIHAASHNAIAAETD